MGSTGKIIQALVFAAIVAGGCLLALGRDTPKRVLIATDDHAIDYPTTQGLVRIKEIIEKQSGGRIQVLIRPGAQLGSEKETIELTQMGIVDINRVSCSPMAEFEPSFAVFSLPYIFRDSAHQWAVLDGPIGRRMLKALAPRRLVGLAYYDSGARSLYNNTRPINHPDDLKGLKIRVQKSEVMIDLIQALGAAANPIAFEEVYSSIQTDRIHGAENNYPSYFTTSHYEVAKYYSLNEHTRVPEIVLFSKKTWDALPQDDRDMIAAAAKTSVARQKALWKKMEKQSEAAVKKAGCKINVPEKKPFADKARPLYEKYGAEHGALIKQILETP